MVSGRPLLRLGVPGVSCRGGRLEGFGKGRAAAAEAPEGAAGGHGSRPRALPSQGSLPAAEEGAGLGETRAAPRFPSPQPAAPAGARSAPAAGSRKVGAGGPAPPALDRELPRSSFRSPHLCFLMWSKVKVCLLFTSVKLPADFSNTILLSFLFFFFPPSPLLNFVCFFAYTPIRIWWA